MKMYLRRKKAIQLTVNICGSGFGVTPEFRFYLSESFSPKGVFIAPSLRYMVHEDQSLAGDGLVIGTQALFKHKITIDAFLEPSFNTDDYFEKTETFFGLRAGVTVGVVLNRLK